MSSSTRAYHRACQHPEFWKAKKPPAGSRGKSVPQLRARGLAEPAVPAGPYRRHHWTQVHGQSVNTKHLRLHGTNFAVERAGTAAAVKPRDDTQNHRIERSPQRCGAKRCGADVVPQRYEASCEPALNPSTERSVHNAYSVASWRSEGRSGRVPGSCACLETMHTCKLPER